MKHLALVLLLVCIGLGLWLLRGSTRDAAQGREPASTPVMEASESHPTIAAVRSEAGRSSASTERSRADTRRVRGTVVLPDGQGLTGAEVGLLLQLGAEDRDALALEHGLSGRDGVFTFNAPLDQGPLFVMAKAPGYRDAIAPVAGDEEIRILLEPNHESVTVTGRVFDTSGLVREFLVLDYVVVSSSRDVRVEEHWTPVLQASDGFSIALATLGSRDVRLVIRARGFLEESRELATNGQHRIDVGDIVLQRSAGHCGRVVNDLGFPVGDATVQPLLEHGAHGPSTRSARGDGSFEILTKEGQEPVALLVTASNYAPRLLRREEAGGFWDGVVVRLDFGARVEGHVLGADGHSTAGVEVLAWLSDATGTELPGGFLGSAEWSRTAEADAAGAYSFERVPRGQVSLAISMGVDDDGSTAALSHVQTLEVADDPLYLCDFLMGGGAEVRGRIDFPEAIPEFPLCLELRSGGVVLASVAAQINQPFVFKDVTVEPGAKRLTLRISVGPGFYVDREVTTNSPSTDLGVFSFPDMKSLMAFNRGERQVFGITESR